MNNPDIPEKDSAARGLNEAGLIPEQDDLNMVVWPGHNPDDLKFFDELDRVKQVVTGSPKYVPLADIYESEDLIRTSKTSHELADAFLEEYNESVFDLEYGHAVREDFTPAQGTLSDEEKVEKIKELGETSNKLLRDGGRAIYNMDRMHQGRVNTREHESFSIEDYMHGHGALFQDVLEGEYFEQVTWTDQVDPGRNYKDETVFIIADDPIYDL
jgi:hypothetical protein